MGSHEQFRTVPFDRVRFQAANQDLRERMDSEGLFLLYDDVLDTLFVDFGAHRDGMLEPLADDVFARIDPASLALAGYEITDFKADFLPSNRLFQPLVDELRLLDRPNEPINAAESTQQETIRRLAAVA